MTNANKIYEVPQQYRTEHYEAEEMCAICGDFFRENLAVSIAKSADGVDQLCINCDPRGDDAACLVVHISTRLAEKQVGDFMVRVR